jgi:DNA uptake protein ComE-like DNA-binding protein
MLKIKYPANTAGFHQEYLEIFENHFASAASRRFQRSDNFILAGMTVEEILTADFDALLGMVDILSLLGEKNGYKESVASIFDYSSFQPLIAGFFMKHAAALNLETCFYCNIEYVNAFKDLADYFNPLDLVNRADEADLEKIEHIGKKTAAEIVRIAKTGEITSIDNLPLKAKAKNALKSMSSKAGKNHFTLDHLFGQAGFPLLSLSLYNLVPSCYSCNTKFKGDTELFDTGPHRFLSPSSPGHAFNQHVLFKLLYRSGDWSTITKEQDIALDFDILQNEDAYRKYLQVFKLRGRYAFHKREAMALITKRKRYSDARIIELSTLTGIPPEKVKEDIFGRELFDDELLQRPLTKLRRDIARAIGIKGVL